MDRQELLEEGRKALAIADPTPPPAPMSEGATLVDVIARAARDPNVDIDKMERLLQMQERVMERQAKAEFAEAMAETQAALRPVIKDAWNDQTRSPYATIAAIHQSSMPVISSHGFSLSFGTGDTPKDHHVRVTCVVSRGGYSESRFIDVPIDDTGIKGTVNKTPTHAVASAITYGQRILTLLIFNIATSKDDDGNSAGNGEPITEAQATTIRAAIDEVGADIEKFCRYMKVDAIPDIPAAHFDRAIAALEAKRAKT